MDLANLISNIGFPIGVSIYVLTRLEKGMKDNHDILIRIEEMLKDMKDD